MPGSIELTDIVLRLLGAFYAFAGYAATRAGMMSHFLDRALAAISAQKPSRAEVAQSAWLIASAALVLVGGVLLLAGLQLAVLAFVASAIGQAAYIYVLAPRYFDREDPPDPRGRRQTTNAFVVYLAATAFILWAAWRERLTPIEYASIIEIAAVSAALLAYAAYVARSLWLAPRQSSDPSSDQSSDESSHDAWGDTGSAHYENDGHARPLHTSSRIKLMAEVGCYPLWALDDDLDGCFAPEDLPLSNELIGDIDAWAEANEASYDPENPAESPWTLEQVDAHEAEGRTLAVRLKRELPDRTVFVHTRAVGVIEVHADDPL